MSNLLEQWNEHIIRGNLLSRELEDIESLLDKSKGADICFTSGTNGSVFIRVLTPEKMQELRENVVVAILRTRDEKAVELEKLMGVRKPATINPEFEAAVQGMIDSVKKKPEPDPVEVKLAESIDKHEKEIKSKPVAVAKPTMSVEDVRRMYLDESKSMKEIAEHFGVTKSVVNNFVYKNHLARYKSNDDEFLDSKVEAKTGKGRA